MKKKAKKRIAITIISLVLVTTGIFLVLYGPATNFVYKATQDNKVKEYEKRFYTTEQSNGTEENTKTSNNNSLPTKQEDNNISNQEQTQRVIDTDKLRKDIRAYNKKIYEDKQSSLGESIKGAINLPDYGISDNIYGYLQIEKINLCMPIYLGLSDYNMSLGAAVMTGSSIPYGGKNTHTVIGGHCGFGYAEYFRYLENLTKGDTVNVYTPFGKRIYKVTVKQVLKPVVSEEYRIQEGKDLVSLFTCHPYPTSTYRLCVTCEREA